MIQRALRLLDEVEHPPSITMTTKPHRKHHLAREVWVVLIALVALFASAVLAAHAGAPDDYRISIETLHAELSATLAEPDSH